MSLSISVPVVYEQTDSLLYRGCSNAGGADHLWKWYQRKQFLIKIARVKRIWIVFVKRKQHAIMTYFSINTKFGHSHHR